MSRILTNGFEFTSLTDNGILSAGGEFSIGTTNPHLSDEGNGGSRTLEANTTGINLAIFEPFNYELPVSYFRIYFRLASLPGTHEYIFYDSIGTTEIFKLRFSSSTGPFTLSVNGIDVANGTQTFEVDTYYCLRISATINASGSINTSINGTSDISYAGATNGGGTGWDQLRLNTDGHVYYDDLAVNDSYSRLNYDGGNGDTPTGTLAGPSSSATIINHIGDGTTGYIIIDNGGAAFSNNDALTDSGTFTGNANGGEDTNSSGSLPDGFIQLFFPDGDGNSTQLTNSNINMTNNYTYVNVLSDTSTYVFSESNGLQDTYTVSELPSDVFDINHVEAYQLIKKDGSVVNNIRNVIRINSIDYESYQEVAPETFEWVSFSIPKNPDTQSDWDISDVNSSELGIKIET